MDVESLLVEVADVLNTTLDLDTLLHRVAEVVKRVIDYKVFGILLLNERTQELRFRFQIGHQPEVAEKIRVKVGQGVTGRAVEERQAILVNDVTKNTDYIEALAIVKSELAVPLITKNKAIGVIDIEARQVCDEAGLSMVRAATVGTHPLFVQMLRELIEERLMGNDERAVIGDYPAWPDACPSDCCPGPPHPGPAHSDSAHLSHGRSPSSPPLRKGGEGGVG